ncbi:MAG: response regulator transcription factor [Prosthecobacter sp.]|nr:response regulator transcription factor [Prosthecobacter sp.]
MPPGPVRVAVVDDHSIMRAVYRTLVEDAPDLDLAWSASTAKEARMHLERDDVPDVVIMDLTLPDGSGYELTREFLQRYPGLPVLVVSAHHDRSYAQEAFECGARGYLVKDSSPHELLHALEAVRSGESYFKPPIEVAS